MSLIESTAYWTIEGTPGTEEHPPAGSAAFEYLECKLKPMPQGGGPTRGVVRATGASPGRKAAAEKWMDVSVKADVKAAASAGGKPEIDVPLKACGFTAVEDAGVSWTYHLGTSVAGEPPLASMSVRKDTRRASGTANYRRAYGIRGIYSEEWTSGGELECMIKGIGALATVANAPAVVNPTYHTGVPLRKLTAFSIGSWSPVVRRISLSTGMLLERRIGGGAGSVDGAFWPPLLTWAIGGAPTLEIEVEEENETINAGLHAAWENATAVAVAYTFAHGSRSRTTAFRAARANDVDPQPGSRPGLVKIQLTAHQDLVTDPTPLSLAWT